MLVRFRLGNVTETRPVHGKLDHHVSAGRKRDGFKQRHVSVEFTKYGNTLFRPVTLPDREFATKEFPHSSCRVIAKFISQVILVNSRAQQTSSAKQTTSIIKIKVNQSSEAQFFEVISGGFFIEKDLTQGTLPCQIPPPLGEIVNFAPPILESR